MSVYNELWWLLRDGFSKVEISCEINTGIIMFLCCSTHAFYPTTLCRIWGENILSGFKIFWSEFQIVFSYGGGKKQYPWLLNSLENNKFLLVWTGMELEDEHLFRHLTVWTERGSLATHRMLGSLFRADFTFPMSLLPCNKSEWHNKFQHRGLQGTSHIFIVKTAF